jgi:hypothetical protein
MAITRRIAILTSTNVSAVKSLELEDENGKESRFDASTISVD